MSEYYQPRKNNPYWLEPRLYRRVKYFVSDYPRLLEQRQEITTDTPMHESGMPRGSDSGDQTANKGIRLAQVNDDIAVIEYGLSAVDPIYRTDVLNWVQYGTIPMTYRRTFERERAALYYAVAKKLKLL